MLQPPFPPPLPGGEEKGWRDDVGERGTVKMVWRNLG